MDFSVQASLLYTLKSLRDAGLISQNEKACAKEALVRPNGTLLHSAQCLDAADDLIDLLMKTSLKEMRRMFDTLFSSCTLNEGKIISRTEVSLAGAAAGQTLGGKLF